MSQITRYRNVKGNITEDIGGDEYIYASEGISEHADGTVKIKSEGGIKYNNNVGEPPSANLVNFYAKIRIPDVSKYQGEYGFDWIDVDPVTGKVEAIQNTSFSMVDYFYKEPDANHPIGQYIPKAEDETGAQNIIRKNYNVLENPTDGGRVDRPFVLIKPGQEITLKVTIHTPNPDAQFKDTETIYINGDEYYEFTLTEETSVILTEEEQKKEDEMLAERKKKNKNSPLNSKRSEVKLRKNGVYSLKIKCLKASPKKNYYIRPNDGVIERFPVGGFTMLENEVLKLKFRVIALVSNEGDPSGKAKKLFKEFMDAGVERYLNENSLNQAGYEVEIENLHALNNLETSDVTNYYYAFDAAKWREDKKLYEKIDYVSVGDGKYYPIKRKEGEPITEQLVVSKIADKEGNEITPTLDFTEDVIAPYHKKIRNIRDKYNDGIILLSDYNTSSIGAFSYVIPFDNYNVFMFSERSKKESYVHEIGHMLSLYHYFYIKKGSEAGYKSVWEEFDADINLKVDLETKAKEDGSFSEISHFRTNKKSGIKALLNSNKGFEKEMRKYKETIDKKSTLVLSNEEEERILSTNRKKIEDYKGYIKTNNLWLEKLKEVKNEKFHTFSYKGIESAKVYNSELVITFGEYINYYYTFLKIVYITFKLGTTYNVMDYENDGRKKFFNYQQIINMRKDYENYK